LFATTVVRPGGCEIERLATILRKLDDASQDPARVDALLATLVDLPGGPFAGAGLFRASRDGRSFVLIASRGCDADAVRAWRRWPLGRLFARMKPARILDPDGAGTFALAVPLCHGTLRYVAIAPLNSRGAGARYRAFFDALESVTIPRADAEVSLPDEIPLMHVEPRIVGLFLCQSLHDRLSTVLHQRGWTLIGASTSRTFHELLVADEPDVVVVDTAELADPIAELRALHHVAASRRLYVMAFESQPRLASQAPILADRFLSHDESDERIFATFKELFRGIDQRRRERSQLSTAVASRHIQELVGPQELADFAAYHAAALMRGWAGIALVGRSGTVYRAEHPQSATAILSKIPTSFLGDAPIFCTRVDHRFLDEICDDVHQRQAFERLEPVSGATLPIKLTDDRLGALVAVSQGVSAEPNAFEALCRLGNDVARRFYDMNSRAAMIPEFKREGLWERLSDRSLEVAVYRSRDCALPWRYHSVSETCGVLTLGVTDTTQLHRSLAEPFVLDPRELAQELAACVSGPNRFAAVVDTATASMIYAARDFSPPMLLGLRGPTGTIGRSEDVSTGVASLSPAAELLICDRRLWRWFGDHHAALHEVSALLNERTPPGLASMVRMGS
jgi:hypothetical protein